MSAGKLADQEEKEATKRRYIDEDKLERCVQDVLMIAQKEVDPEVVLDAAQYTMEEVMAAELDLEGDEQIKQEIISGGSLSLTSIEQHPLYGIVQQVCIELLGIAEEEAVMMTSDVLDAYYSPEVEVDPTEGAGKTVKQRRGVLGECEMCERCMMLTEHHLIPRSTHSTLHQKGVFTKTEMLTRLAMLCRPCHSFVHHHISSMELALTFNTVETLLERPDVYKWARYANKLKERDPAWGLTRGLRNKR